MSSSGDLWYVKLGSGDVHKVTLDQLDEAFQAGHVDENTMVLAANGTRWMKLGDAAGLDDAPAPAPAPVTATNTTTSPSSPGDSPLTPRFTDQQKQKLLDSDKQHDQKAKAHAATHAASTTGGSSHASPRSKSPVFTTSGNKFDPLNSSI
jgi:hypothetical protein